MPLLTTNPTLAPATPAAPDTTPATVENWSDLELCVALYWVRRHRRRGDLDSARVWTERLDLLLDWRLAHGPHVPLPHEA